MDYLGVQTPNGRLESKFVLIPQGLLCIDETSGSVIEGISLSWKRFDPFVEESKIGEREKNLGFIIDTENVVSYGFRIISDDKIETLYTSSKAALDEWVYHLSPRMICMNIEIDYEFE